MLKQLIDPIQRVTYGLDRKKLLFKICKDDQAEEIRLRPLHSDLLGVLFDEHPKPVAYSSLNSKLKKFGMSCPDVTRLHRRMSELRQELEEVDPVFKNAIENIRGVGYSLPLSWRVYEENEVIVPVNFDVRDMSQVIQDIDGLVQESIELASHASIVKRDGWYVQDRKSIGAKLDHMVRKFNQLEQELRGLITRKPSDFLMIRVQYQMALLRTYVGLSRMCDNAISSAQWKTWHSQEIIEAFCELKSWITKG